MSTKPNNRHGLQKTLLKVLRRIVEPVTYDSNYHLVPTNIKCIMLYNVGIDVQLQQKSIVRGFSQGKQRRASPCEVDTTNIVLLKEKNKALSSASCQEYYTQAGYSCRLHFSNCQ